LEAAPGAAANFEFFLTNAVQRFRILILEMGLAIKNWVRVCCAVAAGAVVCPAPAQNTVPTGTPIIVSSPEGDGQSPPWSATPTRKAPFDSANQVQAPRSLLEGSDSVDETPVPPINPVQPWQQGQPQKNWTEMTPEEIFGLPAPGKTELAKVLKTGLEAPEASPLDKFLLQQRLTQTSSTNGSAAFGDGWKWFGDRPGFSDQEGPNALHKGALARPPALDRFFSSGVPGSKSGSSANPDEGWSEVFTPPRSYQPTPEQVAENKAFDQLIHPTEATSGAKNPAAGGRYEAPVAPAVDPFLEPQPPGYNSAGTSFQPLVSGIGRPKGLTPLTAVNSRPSAPAAPPAWAPKPPPWMQDGPQLFVNPVRKW
jgi:hypothetical protein